MNFTKLVLRRPVSVVMIIIIIIIFGISSMTGMEQELTPEMNLPMLVVVTQLDGANPEDVDELVTKVVEDNVSSQSGVTSVTSQSSEGSSIVMLQYDYNTEISDAYDDINKKLSIISAQLPESCSTPVIMELDMNSMPSMTLTVSGEPAGGLYNYVNNTLSPDLESLSTVSEVSVAGGAQEYISVSLDRNAMEQYRLSVSDVASAIAGADFTSSIGDTKLGNLDIDVSAGQDFETLDSLNSVAITLAGGNVIQLSDVAEIGMAQKEQTSVSRYDGQDTMSLSISKEQSSTASQLSKQVLEVVEQHEADYEDVSVIVENDDAESISSSISSVFQTLILAIIISMIIIFLFMGDLRASLIIASSMPVSVLVALILMSFMNYTLNMVTMCALVIGVGMMVDNSIVVLESCFRSKEKGLSLFDAAVEGTKTVMASVVAGTITTVVVFLPLAFLGGMSGQLFEPLGFVIIFALSASLLSAITIVPLAYYKYQPTEKDNAPLSRFMRWLTAAYRRTIEYLLHRKKLVFGTVMLLLVVSVLAVSQTDSELMSSTDEGTISVSVTAQGGLNLEETEKLDAEVEKVIVADEDVEHYSLTAGGSGIMSSSGSSFTVYLKDDRSRDTDEIVEDWKVKMQDIRNCEIDVSSSSAMSSMTSDADTVSIVLTGENYTDLQEACTQISDEIKKRADVSRVKSSFSDGTPTAKIEFDPQLCAAYGFNASSVASTVNAIMNGVTATNMIQDGEEYEVIAEYANESYDSAEEISHIQVTSNTGYTVDLSDIATIVYKDSATTITKEDGSYNATVDIEIKPEYVDSSYSLIQNEVEGMSLPKGVEFGQDSISQSMNDEFASLFKAIFIAIFLVFAVMTMQFESARFSLMVMVCIPFCFVGSFLILYFTGTSISMVALMGFIMLIGTVVNAGILYVDTVNANRKTMDLDTALIEAGVTRLRPILMTTLTTICSMIPLALGSGENAEMLQGFAIVAIGGLTASTLMALLMLPTFYLTICKKDKKDKSERKAEKARKKEEKKELKARKKADKTEAKKNRLTTSD